MATVFSPAEQRVILRNISWETYERLLAERGESSSPRFTYDQGVLEIMVVSFEHEQLNRLIADLFTMIAFEMNIEFINGGSTTFKREDLRRGFEPDTCFYIQNAEHVSGKAQIDLFVDPPPDLIIEIDITHSSLDKLPIYTAVGVPEVWRYDGNVLTIFRLEHGTHIEHEESLALPGVTSIRLLHFIEESRSLKRTAWLRSVQNWAREQVEERNSLREQE
jgi:Uma2 family endonuclease